MINTFDEVLAFAISREEDAVLFYQFLQGKARFAPQKEVLKEFELMEVGHVRLLEGVKKRHSIEKLSQTIPEDLQLSSYLHDVEPDENMSYQQILVAAMKKEERAAMLYTALRDQAEDIQIRQVLLSW
ncbi:ferritin family protein [Oceanispirochaeta sp.]|jgi:rubrerythrin|uniref:ferritin family protein n=1 Tax=Oceanispirochaeta sp. TaxID=2035350 RepID=UPI002624693D|nr:ferritin family protein [Oceanispirochaeta sp.]MDA3955830.1 ferritin family protein [Oceanispirochaeta sp.]